MSVYVAITWIVLGFFLLFISMLAGEFYYRYLARKDDNEQSKYLKKEER